MGWQDDPIVKPAAASTPAPWESDPITTPASQPQPDMQAGNGAFARVISRALYKPDVLGTGERAQMGHNANPVTASVEGALNVATGVGLGFPAYLGGAIGGLIDKHAPNIAAGMRFGIGGNTQGTNPNGVDPKEMAEYLQKLVTYAPQSEEGQRAAEAAGTPFSLISQGSEAAGHKVTDVTGSPLAGAITDQTLQMLAIPLLHELGRKLSGQPVTSEDMSNVAKVVASDAGKPEAAPAVEQSLRATYAKTGIGPYTVAEEAARDPKITADLVNPDITIPKGIEDQIPPELPQEPDGKPVLDVSGPTVDEAREEVPGVNAGMVDLNMGLNPAASLKAIADSYTPFVGVDALDRPKLAPEEEARAGFVDAVQKLVAPAARGDIANLQAGIMRANFGEMAHEREVALESLKASAAKFDKLSPEENIKFIDSMERGTPDPKFAAEAGALRALLDDRRQKVQDLGGGKLENFDENYFPHMWKDEKAAAQVFSRRPLEGSKGFLKARTIPFTVDGMRWRAYGADGDFIKSYDTEGEAKAAAPEGGRVGAPLKPITTNPVEMALLKTREMDKYIYGQKIFEEMKANDLARFVPFGGEAPPGWTKINDKIARVMHPGEDGGMVLRGDYYAPDEAATLINNHLSPGWQGNKFYDALRQVGAAMNSLQLGLSFFHVGFTTLDSMISRVALGVKQASRGDVVNGAGNMAVGMSPAQPFLNILKGDKLLRAYLGDPNDPSLAPIVDAIQQAGGRVKMDDFYRNTSVNEFKQALRRGDSWEAAKALLPTVLDRVGAPIFEWLVPRQKLGVFFDMAKDWLEKHPDADLTMKREGLGKLWDSVDNRMGQLVYDNVFWNRAFKDGLMASVRSVGWNLGTFRELGGGVADVKDIVKNRGLTDRTAYVVALPLVTALYGAMTQYAYTGEGPRDMKDLFFPRTGRTRPDGSEDRVSLPTYMKDVYAYAEDAANFGKYGGDPTQTLKNKMHPLISTISEMLDNKDFFGGAIRNPADPLTQQVYDEANFLMHQVEPFSLRNYQQQAKTEGKEPTVGGYLTDNPALIGITPAPGYLTKSAEMLESEAVSRLRDPLIRKFREEIKDGRSVDEVIPEALRAGLSRQDIKFLIRSSGDTPAPRRLRSFKEEATQ